MQPVAALELPSEEIPSEMAVGPFGRRGVALAARRRTCGNAAAVRTPPGP